MKRTVVLLLFLCLTSWLVADSLDDEIKQHKQQINQLNHQIDRLWDRIIAEAGTDDAEVLQRQAADLQQQEFALQLELTKLEGQKDAAESEAAFAANRKQSEAENKKAEEQARNQINQQIAIAEKQTANLMQSWVGASKDQLLSSWGPPSSTFVNGDTEVWTYTNPQGTWVRQFYFNKKGIIYSWRWQGL